jgi:hypothetical protein
MMDFMIEDSRRKVAVLRMGFGTNVCVDGKFGRRSFERNLSQVRRSNVDLDDRTFSD